MSRSSTAWRTRDALSCALAFLLFLGGLPTAGVRSADAGDECREIRLSGVAGTSYVEIRVVDARPSGTPPLKVENADVITRSCPIVVDALTPAADLIRAIPDAWGDGSGGDCTRHCTAGQPPTNTCVVDSDCNSLMLQDGVCGGRTAKQCRKSCWIEARVKQKKSKCAAPPNDPFDGKACLTKRDCGGIWDCPGAGTVGACPGIPGETCATQRSLRICCRAAADCGGGKLAGDDTIPITIQTKLDGAAEGCTAGTWCPADTQVPSSTKLALRFSNPKPASNPTIAIRGESLPHTSERVCRAAVLAAQEKISTAAANYFASHPCTGTYADCKTAIDAANDAGVVSAIDNLVNNVVPTKCESTRWAPSDFGYDGCSAPCGDFDAGLKTCSAGKVGACQRNFQCDSMSGDGTGRCGGWSVFGACQTCQALEAARVAQALPSQTPLGFSAQPSVAARSMRLVSPGELATCERQIRSETTSLLTVTLKDIVKCQKSVDAGKLLLPDETPLCKNADPKEKRAKAREKAAANLDFACSDEAVALLDTCASNVAGLKDCVVRTAQEASAIVADSTLPEGRCGDGNQAFGEECDDGNLVDGDGCDSNCTQTRCGNGIVTAGEQCDDRNTLDNDGCSATCQSEPQSCAPQMCGNFTYDCSALFPGACVCLNAGGVGSCVNNFNCATAQVCPRDCPPGQTCCPSDETCYFDTCCGGPPGTGVCGPRTCTAP